MEQTDPNDQRVRDRAYYLWEADGSPDGMAETYWHRARLELGEEENAYDKILKAMPQPIQGPPAWSSHSRPGA
jgi:hypothetical protein